MIICTNCSNDLIFDKDYEMWNCNKCNLCSLYMLFEGKFQIETKEYYILFDGWSIYTATLESKTFLAPPNSEKHSLCIPYRIPILINKPLREQADKIIKRLLLWHHFHDLIGKIIASLVLEVIDE